VGRTPSSGYFFATTRIIAKRAEAQVDQVMPFETKIGETTDWEELGYFTQVR
jgi:hypothetical protein